MTDASHEELREKQRSAPPALEHEDWAKLDWISRTGGALRNDECYSVERAIHRLRHLELSAEERGELIPGKIESRGPRFPDQVLRDAADLFESRNAEYGSDYLLFGERMKAFFPDGVTLKSVADFQRFGILVFKFSKLSRYINAWTRGGHPDSSEDDIVYTAMLRQVDEMSKKENPPE